LLEAIGLNAKLVCFPWGGTGHCDSDQRLGQWLVDDGVFSVERAWYCDGGYEQPRVRQRLAGDVEPERSPIVLRPPSSDLLPEREPHIFKTQPTQLIYVIVINERQKAARKREANERHRKKSTSNSDNRAAPSKRQLMIHSRKNHRVWRSLKIVFEQSCTENGYSAKQAS
jgi:hypothetical protein